MIILASDTSGKSISVSLFRDGSEVNSFSGDMGMTHSQTHMPLIMDILKKSKTAIDDVDIFACTTGPGSYTGIRIGIATIKALAYGLNRKTFSASTLDVLAHPFLSTDCLVIPLIYARNNRFFSAGYLNGEKIISEGNYHISDINQIIYDYLEKSPETCSNIKFCGDGSEIFRNENSSEDFTEKIREINGCDVSYEKTLAEARDLARILLEKINSGQSPENFLASPFDISANYISASSAERMKNQRGKNG